MLADLHTTSRLRNCICLEESDFVNIYYCLKSNGRTPNNAPFKTPKLTLPLFKVKVCWTILRSLRLSKLSSRAVDCGRTPPPRRRFSSWRRRSSIPPPDSSPPAERRSPPQPPGRWSASWSLSSPSLSRRRSWSWWAW